MKALQIEAFGNPAEVVKTVEMPDVGPPAADEVVIAVEASPINQYDLLDRWETAALAPFKPRPFGAAGRPTGRSD
jgi:NADPH:quinone reductase-like Zn-dependent oxidoreductase